MSDVIDLLIKGFAEGVEELPAELAADLTPAVARVMGRRAARYAIAPLIWSALQGDTLDTTQVARYLGVSRQALAKRLTNGSILGLPGRGTTHYPVWQFTPELKAVRADVREIFKIFIAELGSLDAYAVSAWMTTASEELNGLSPKDWLLKEDDPQSVYEAARRTAGRLAS
jgi:hypothetical protein